MGSLQVPGPWGTLLIGFSHLMIVRPRSENTQHWVRTMTFLVHNTAVLAILCFSFGKVCMEGQFCTPSLGTVQGQAHHLYAFTYAQCGF